MDEMRPMTDNVDRLKQLLFDTESQTLSDLARRLDALSGETGQAARELADSIRELGDREGRSRAELQSRLDVVMSRVGSDADLERTVASLLDGILRRAETNNHENVSHAVAPFVVKTVRTEIRNSKDELVEALYPVTGRIVKAYVASAMKDLADQINRRLEMNPVMLRLRSMATGRSVAELAIADTQKLTVEDLYLIRRGTGELVAHWPQSEHGANRSQVMSGVLTAINEFTTEAFSADGAALRHIDLGSDRVYLRESPVYLLAARCSGSAPVSVEAVVDESFLSAIETIGTSQAPQQNVQLLQDLSENLESRIGETHAQISGRRLGISPLKVLAYLIGLPLIGWFAWSLYGDYRTDRVQRLADAVLASSPEVKGYPTTLSVGWLGRDVTWSGLVPTAEAKNNVLERLRGALPGLPIKTDVAIVPNALANVEPELQRLRDKTARIEPRIGDVSESVGGLETRIEQVDDTVAGLETRLKREAQARDIARATRLLVRTRLAVLPMAADLDAQAAGQSKKLVADLDRSIAELETAAGLLAGSATGEATAAAETSLRTAADRVGRASQVMSGLLALRPAAAAEAGPPASALSALLAEAEQIDTVAVALAQVFALRKAIPAPVTLPQPDARARLEAWCRANAIFFSEDAEYADPLLAERQIRELAKLMKDASALVRVVGYTDELGGANRNSPLSLSRARKVADGLRDNGVADARVAVIGRSFGKDISVTAGAGSPNRRVEFEVGFIGETAQ